MDLTRLKQINEDNANRQAQAQEKLENKLAQLDMQETVVKSFAMLLDYLEGNIAKTVVVNQIKDFTTRQDAERYIQSIDSLHETLKTHKNTDITPLTEVMNRVLAEVKAIPKDKVELEIPEHEEIDYSDKFDALAKALDEVNAAIKAQDLNVEAPVVNVEAPTVQVDAPDLKPLSKDLEKAFKTAISGIKYPELPKFDVSEVVKQQKKTNKLLEDLPTGGGGGGSSWPAVNDDGNAAPLAVDATGAVKTSPFAPNANITTDLSTPGTIIETDGTRTLTTVITSTEITETWS